MDIKKKIKDALLYLLVPFYSLFFSLLKDYFRRREKETGETL